MKTTVIPAIKNALFYVPFFGGGAALIKQFHKIPGGPAAFETLASLEQKVIDGLDAVPYVSEQMANSAVNSLEFLFAAGLSIYTAKTIKKRMKKREFKKLISHSEAKKDTDKPKVSLSRKAGRFVGKASAKGGLAALAGGSLLASGFFFPQIYDFFSNQYDNLASKGGEVLEQVLSNPFAKTVLALTSIEAGSKLYSLFNHRKHGPIMRRYFVDGYMAPTRMLHPKRLGIRRTLGFQPSSTRGMHAETIICARITSEDYGLKDGKIAKKNKRIMWMGYRRDLEPHRIKEKLSVNQVESVLSYMRERSDAGDKEEKSIKPSEVPDIAKKSRVYSAVDHGQFGDDLTKFDIGRIVKGLSQIRKANIFDENLETVVTRLNNERLWDVGGYFQVSVYDGDPLSARISLRESIMQSDSISRDPRGGYGEDYIHKGKMLMVLPYRAYESGKVEQEPTDWIEGGFGDAVKDAEGMSSNIIREDRKGWNQLLRLGFGKNYLIYFGNDTFTYDEWWTGSGKFITDLIPGLRGKELAPRRIGYVYDKHWKIIAKIEDAVLDVPTKPFGNYNRIVDVYDRQLAKNENFGALLCAFSRFLTHQKSYRENRAQEMLPDGTLLTATGDLDWAGQV